MKSLCLGVLLLAVMSSTAWAGGYSDFNAAVAARNRGSDTEALRLFSSAISAPDLPKQMLSVAYFDRGTIYFGNGDAKTAIADFTACLTIAPNYVPALEARGAAYLRAKDYDHAQTDFEAVVSARPDLSDGRNDLVDLNIARKTFDAALKISNSAIEKWPHSDTPYIMRGDVYRAMGQHDTAMDDYDTAVSKNSRSVEARVSRAKAYEDVGELKDALSDLEDAADYLPAESEIHGQIGSLQWDLGRFDDAQNTFQSMVGGVAPWPYAPLWLFLSQAKADPDTHPVLQEGNAKSDAEKWPAPLVRLFSGGVSADSILKTASEADTATKAARQCEADFFVAEWHLFHGARSEAIRSLNEAAGSCEKDAIEKVAATAELARLKQDSQ